MRRRNNTALVKNEEKVLIMALDLLSNGEVSFHGYRISRQLKEKTETRPMAYTTLYRCLVRLEERELLKSKWITPDDGAQPKRVYTLTKTGKAAAKELKAASQD
ncbi:MAG: hypothetical protein GXP36_12650 [Actinobacteria bacterium]|uniref:Transcription regulator PadR N-terminal domain-containing protein n=1 Tax=hydrothermal vent metagenome TaxID=652676 RepID=A0A3B0SRI0_9ZZZZ|nr:hypothetical protein [Actinomycetota bacterium]